MQHLSDHRPGNGPPGPSVLAWSYKKITDPKRWSLVGDLMPFDALVCFSIAVVKH